MSGGWGTRGGSGFALKALLGHWLRHAEMGVVRACVSDVKAQCAGVNPGEGRIRECIKTHLKDLSEPCQTLVLKAVTVKACAADVKKVCAGTKPGRGRVRACMKDHLADVSEPCKEALARGAAGKN